METSNLTTASPFKDLILTKLSCAVSYSVITHLTTLFLYFIVVNFNVDLEQWFQSTFNVLTSTSTWLSLFLFAIVIIGQTIICSKDYIFKIKYETSRFRKYISIFSYRTFGLCCFHIIGGGLAVWLYLSLIEQRKEALYIECEDDERCLQEGSFFLILNGVWIGFYFFFQIQTRDKMLLFPVIQQSKFQYFKSEFLNIFKASRNFAIYPTVYFAIFYNAFSSNLCELFTSVFGVNIAIQEFNTQLYLFAWLFSSFYIMNMNVMQFCFKLFLTEPIELCIVKTYENEASLSEALLLDYIPVLQHLACLDFYLLSLWSPSRRQSLYTLSQPGGHPHTWNRLVESALKLLLNFMESINKSMDAAKSEDKRKIKSDTALTPALLENMLKNPVVSPMPNRNPSMRRMDTLAVDSVEIIEVQRRNVLLHQLIDSIAKFLSSKLSDIVEYIKNLPTIKYLFGDLPEAQIEECLKHGQLIVWVTQGLANIVVASLEEDPYGVIQRDLPVILTNLVQLKTALDKLNKLPLNTRRGTNSDNFKSKISNSVYNATKRSLTKICRKFSHYLRDIPLDRDILINVHSFL